MNPGAHPLVDGLPPRWATAWGEDRWGVFAGFTVGEADHRLRWIPAGRFLMGSPKGEAGRYDDEGPQHEVELNRGYWLGETPVTQALWTAVMGANPSRFEGAERPVENVSWDDCQAFLRRLNEVVPGLGARLPTEAEWERACRGGTESATWLGDLDLEGEGAARLLDRIAWYDDNSGGETKPVGQKEANPLGLYDMLGNVWEWCQDWLGDYEPGLFIEPVGPPTGSSRVLRGGSWLRVARVVRAAYRLGYLPGIRYRDLGFRLAGGQGSALPPSQQAEPRRGAARR